MASKQQWIYPFGTGNTKDKYLLGGKGAGLGEMTKIGLPVPPGFTIITAACVHYSKTKKQPEGLPEETVKAIGKLEADTGKVFGGQGRNGMLLLSVRSGAAMSMPGMMDTVLNLGLNDKSVEVLAKLTGNERFAFDSYRRFIHMYCDVVMNVEHALFEEAIHKMKHDKRVKVDTDLTAKDLRELCDEFKRIVQRASKGKSSFPQDPYVQLKESVEAVFRSWDTDRAVFYRNMNGISHTLGTAVNVQAMVFGNMGDDSGTGVAFTRSPTTGEAKFYGEYLTNAQGEDVVAGIRTPEPIASMATRWPKIYKELSDNFHLMEKHFKEMQDVEFTIEKGKLYMLQTRKGKRTAGAALKIAVDMYNEGLMTRDEAVLAVDPTQLDQLLHKQLDPAGKKQAKLVGHGNPASPGAAVGTIVFTAEEALKVRDSGTPVVLVRTETSPEDIQGMEVSQGVLTQRGGMTSHAAVVARGMGRCCVTGCEALILDPKAGTMKLGSVTLKRGDWVTLDGSTGEIFAGKVPVRDPVMSKEYELLMSWADQIRTLEVRTNADTPADAKKARDFGAQGIGLVRTEHMFFAEERINIMRTMILAENDQARDVALKNLLPFQQADFEGIFTAMTGLPVIIRLLDPPLHEFMPHEDNEIALVAKLIPGATAAAIKAKVHALAETNPMLGFRGVRLGIVYPQIVEMQIRAIFLASLACLKRGGVTPLPEIEVPLVGNLAEYLPIKHMVQRVAKETGAEGKVHYKVGSMIEVPRAAIVADELASECDFLSFGTNDLTQMTCGFSRDDASKFLGDYVRQGIYERDPFVSIDQDGVGKMMKITVALSRAVKPNIDIGICGEHGGEPTSVEFCHRIGLSNVSCSPFRVPVARLAAAQARIKYGPSPKSLSVADILKVKVSKL